MPKISIVLPVYNGENFLPRTLESLLAQSLRDFEIIAVDDGSSDQSEQILTELSIQDSRLKVLTKPNGGSAVRSVIFALPHCQGDYFFYCSQDDLLSENCLEEMYNRAYETNADAVLPDMEWYSDDTGAKAKGIFAYQNNYDALLNGQQALTLSLNWQIHGFSLRKMELVRQVGYDDNYANSDEYISRLFYANCTKVGFCKGVFKYRQDNPDAMTKKYSIIAFDWLATDIRILELVAAQQLPDETIRKQVKRTIKSLRKKYRLLKKHKAVMTADERKRAQLIISTAQQALLSFCAYRKLASEWLKAQLIAKANHVHLN